MGPSQRSCLLLLALGLLVACAADQGSRRLLQQSQEEKEKAVLKTVQDFCRSPEIKKLKCGWATAPGDKSSTQARDCDLCGTIWSGSIKESDLPHKFDVSDHSSFQRNTLENGYVSLACPAGRLVVRTVYKILTAHDPSDGYAHLMLHPFGEMGSLGSNGIGVYRCDLVLPDFQASPAAGETSKSEVDAALKSKEINCKFANTFNDLKTGKWYSDTYSFDWSGCEGVLKPGVTNYQPTRPWITANNNRPGLLLAKFEVQPAASTSCKGLSHLNLCSG